MIHFFGKEVAYSMPRLYKRDSIMLMRVRDIDTAPLVVAFPVGSRTDMAWKVDGRIVLPLSQIFLSVSCIYVIIFFR